MNNIITNFRHVPKMYVYKGKLCYRNISSSLTRSAISIGDRASVIKSFTQDEVNTFAKISGDNNPIHIDEHFAKTTRYEKRIVHGVLVVGILSGILGTKLPGTGSVLISYEVKHLTPLFIGETIEAEAVVQHIQGRKVTMEMTCRVPESDKVILNGTSTLLVPRDKLI